MTSPGNDRGAKDARGDARRDRRLVRYLHGELSAADARALESELGRDPALAARLAELERLWSSLEPPASEPVPPGAGARLARRALERERRPGRLLGWLLGDGVAPVPAWGRPLAAAALAAGLALGFWLGQGREGLARAGAAGTVAAVEPARAEAGPAVEAAPAPAAKPGREEAIASTGRGDEGTGGQATREAGERAPAPALAPAPAPAPAPEGSLEEWAELEPEDEAAAGGAFAGEITLAEAYLRALESGDDLDWEGSGP